MSNLPPTRWPRVLFAVGVFLTMALHSPPSSPHVDPARSEPPSADEVAALVDLYEWILGGKADGRFHAFDGAPVSAAIENHREGFELFRRYHDGRAQLAVVEKLRFGRDIARSARRYGVDPLLVAAVVEAESGFDSQAISPAGAFGLMQVTPETAALYGGGDPFDPAVNLEVGSRLLAALLEQFDGDLTLALAAYNAGPGAVERFGGLPPYRETRGFVDRVLGLYVEHHRAVWQLSPDRGILF
ncbi:MAG: lytic transglycosylase domain-containing protein [Thermoanaerobaculia bacterium]